MKQSGNFNATTELRFQGMDKKMETTIQGLGLRVWSLGDRTENEDHCSVWGLGNGTTNGNYHKFRVAGRK